MTSHGGPVVVQKHENTGGEAVVVDHAVFKGLSPRAHSTFSKRIFTSVLLCTQCVDCYVHGLVVVRRPDCTDLPSMHEAPPAHAAAS